MLSIFIVARNDRTGQKLQAVFSDGGFACAVALDRKKALDQIVHSSPDLVVVEIDDQVSRDLVKELSGEKKLKRRLPVMALIGPDMLNNPEGYMEANDFIVQPFNNLELILRAKRLAQKGRDTEPNEVIKSGNLMMDITNCEVFVDGNLVDLTYKEFQLLRFLATSKGRVFTREGLLNKVWGYDYFGGDRTVDVHVRRLRSKIESRGYTFIETVRNIGYRFRNNI